MSFFLNLIHSFLGQHPVRPRLGIFFLPCRLSQVIVGRKVCEWRVVSPRKEGLKIIDFISLFTPLCCDLVLFKRISSTLTRYKKLSVYRTGFLAPGEKSAIVCF